MKPTLKFKCAIWCHFALIPLGKAMNTIYSSFSPTANHSRDRKKSKYMDKSLTFRNNCFIRIDWKNMENIDWKKIYNHENNFKKLFYTYHNIFSHVFSRKYFKKKMLKSLLRWRIKLQTRIYLLKLQFDFCFKHSCN